MKRLFRFCALLTMTAFLAACSTGNDGGGGGDSPDGGGGGTVKTTQATRQLDLTAGSFSTESVSGMLVYEIPADVSTVTVSGISANRKVYLTKTNPTGSTLASNLTQAVSTAEGVTLSNAEQYSTKNNSTNWMDILIGLIGILLGGNVQNFIPPVNLSSSIYIPDARISRAATQYIDRSGQQLTLNVNSTTKNIFVDNDKNISTFVQKPATLRANGTYCNVWVVDEYYANSGSGSTASNMVNSSICQTFADKFDTIIYPDVTTLFGKESDQIYYDYSGNDFSSASMEKLSDTGMFTYTDGTQRNKVNIVIYDIGKDSTSGNVLGYFYAKDYFPNETDIQTMTGKTYGTGEYKVLKSSNEGKYFYIDSYFAKTKTNDTLSTLAHEFQHMINWHQKNMRQNLEPSAAFNEMLSMLCEDVMQSKLGLTADESPIARLPLFARCYVDCGLEYREDSSYYTILSYAQNYAFGAWLVRNYGGRALVSRMSQNNAVDTASIEMASNQKMDVLLKEFALACINKTVAKTFNTSNEGFTAIDLWNLRNTLPSTYSELSSSTTYYKFDGPQLLGYDAQYALRPYGINLLDVGTTNDTSFRLNLKAASVADDEHVYLIIK